MSNSQISQMVEQHLQTRGYGNLEDLLDTLLSKFPETEVISELEDEDVDILIWMEEEYTSMDQRRSEMEAYIMRNTALEKQWEESLHGRVARGEFPIKALKRTSLAGGGRNHKYNPNNPSSSGKSKTREVTELVYVVEIDKKLYKVSSFWDLETFRRYQKRYSTVPSVYSSNLDQDWVG